MVGASDRIFVAKASPPAEDQPASLVFEPADAPDVISHHASNGVSIAYRLLLLWLVSTSIPCVTLISSSDKQLSVSLI